MSNEEIERLIARRLTGEATSQELSDLRLWLNDNDKNKEEFSRIALVYQLSQNQSTSGRKKKILEKINSRISEHDGKSTLRYSGLTNRLIKASISIAASLITIISLGYLLYTNNIFKDQQNKMLGAVITKSNPAGQKSKVFLPDGSIVWLNSESSLTYEQDFSDSSRQVHLTGEAYFEVMKDASRPFVVYSGSISTTALGTAFNINAFDQRNITVSLTEGKVSVNTTEKVGNSNSLVINPGEGVVYNPRSEKTMEIIEINPIEVKMWKDGLLRLNHASLQETITRLERWYGVDIILNNNTKEKWDANGTFSNEYLENVLNALSFSQNFEYEIQRKKVFITFKNKVPM